jgi:hypothetical protein
MRRFAVLVVNASLYLARLMLRRPHEAVGVIRAAGAVVLDRRFDALSPIPWLPEALEAALGTVEVRLPPAGLLEPGNQDFNGLIRLTALAKLLEVRCIFEIGTYNGLTALTLASNVPPAVVHTLDLPPGAAPSLAFDDQDASNIDAERARVFRGQPDAARIVEHFGDSATFDFGPWEGLVDLFYVDGAHSLEYVRNDSRLAFACVSRSGVIIWDDYWRRVPDVPEFLHTQTARGLYRLAGTRLVVWFGEQASTRLRAVAESTAIK